MDLFNYKNNKHEVMFKYTPKTLKFGHIKIKNKIVSEYISLGRCITILDINYVYNMFKGSMQEFNNVIKYKKYLESKDNLYYNTTRLLVVANTRYYDAPKGVSFKLLNWFKDNIYTGIGLYTELEVFEQEQIFLTFINYLSPHYMMTNYKLYPRHTFLLTCPLIYIECFKNFEYKEILRFYSFEDKTIYTYYEVLEIVDTNLIKQIYEIDREFFIWKG